MLLLLLLLLPSLLLLIDFGLGALLHSFSCKKATLGTVQWTHDERLVFHMVTNEVHVYDRDFCRVGKLRYPGVASFSLPPVKGAPPNALPGAAADAASYLLTVFAPGAKGKPARVDLLRYPDRLGRDTPASGPSLAFKSLFNAEEVTVQWSPRADAALLLTSTAVDNTGASYYGSTHLFLLLASTPKTPGAGAALAVPLPPEAAGKSSDGGGAVPIVAADWITNPHVVGPVPFAVIAGNMPALASLHHGVTAEPTFLFGRAHRNTLDVSPHGRFLACGGYGNLAGGMDFWDRHKGKRIPRRVQLPEAAPDGGTAYVTVKEPADLVVPAAPSPVVGHQWAPDSRTYLVSTTSPRMNVENGAHVYRYDGSLVDAARLPWDNARYRPDKLLCAEYVPAPPPPEGDKAFYYYPDRPQSPPPRGAVELKGEAAARALAALSPGSGAARGKDGGGARRDGSGGALAAAAYVPPAARGAGGGAYVPPGARRGGAQGGGGLAARMRQEREGSAATVAGVKVSKRTGPVGAASVANAAGVGGAAGDKSKSALRREKQRLAKERAEQEAAEAARREEEEARARAEANRADPEKRAKKIKKTLKQIDEIKKKKEGGVDLNEDQVKKLASEESLREELAQLGL